MKDNKFMFYSEYLKGKSILEKDILVSKTKTSYLIGPLLNEKFDNNSFYKRLISNSIYTVKIYKKISRFKAKKLIKKYINDLNNNEVIEVFKDGNILNHKIIRLPGENNEKK